MLALIIFDLVSNLVKRTILKILLEQFEAFDIVSNLVKRTILKIPLGKETLLHKVSNLVKRTILKIRSIFSSFLYTSVT